MVDVMLGLTGHEPVASHLAVGHENQPVLVVPARIARAGGDGEPEVRPVPAGLPRQEREETVRTALARVGGPAGQPVNDQPRGFRRQPQAEVASTPPAATSSWRMYPVASSASTSWITTSPAGSDGGSMTGRHSPRRVSACGAPRAAALHRTRIRWMVITTYPAPPGRRSTSPFPDLPPVVRGSQREVHPSCRLCRRRPFS